MIQKQKLIPLLAFILFAMLPLFHTGFFPIHDDEQIGRLYDLDQVLKAWHIPPRIAPNLGFGYGYPFFNFYPPFVYYIAEVFKLLGFSYIVATKIMIGLGFFAAAIFMYLFSKKFFGKTAAVVCAIAYTYAPYHGVDLYVRGALPEFWAFAFLPALFWLYLNLKENLTYKYVFFTALCIACFILTHNLIFFMSVPFIGLFIVFLMLKSAHRRKFLILSVISILLGFGLSSYFWLPSYFEKQYTMIDLLTTELANYSIHFVYLRQFWNSAWGYGGSILGPYDGLTFQIGKAQIIFSLPSFILALSVFRRKKEGLFLLLFFGLFGFSVFMATGYSKFIWDSIQPLWYIQFPWRYLLFSAFTGSFLIGGIFLTPLVKSEKRKVLLATLLGILIIAISKDYFQPQRFIDVSDDYYTNQEKLRFETSRLAAEYTPKGIATRKTDINTTVVDIDKNAIAKKSYEIISGNLSVLVNKELPQIKEFSIDVKTDSVLRINTYSFPGWKVYVDNKEVSYTDDNRLKLITITLLQGTHKVQAIFTDTPVRIIGNIISVSSFLLLIGWLFIRKRFHFRKF